MIYFINFSYDIISLFEYSIQNITILNYSLPNNLKINSCKIPYTISSTNINAIFNLSDGTNLFCNYDFNNSAFCNIEGFDSSKPSFWSTPVELGFNSDINVFNSNISIWSSKIEQGTVDEESCKIYAYVNFDNY